MNEEEVQPATMEQVNKTIEYMNRPEVKEMWERWDEESARIRKVYVDNPERKTTFDIVEIFWYEFLERYGKALDDEQMSDVIDSLVDYYRWHEVIYDVVHQYAKQQDWNEKY